LVRADDVRQIVSGVAGKWLVGCILSIELHLDGSARILGDDEIAHLTGYSVEEVRQSLAMMPSLGFQVDHLTPAGPERRALHAVKESTEPMADEAIAHALGYTHVKSVASITRKLHECELIRRPEGKQRRWVITPRGTSLI